MPILCGKVVPSRWTVPVTFSCVHCRERTVRWMWWINRYTNVALSMGAHRHRPATGVVTHHRWLCVGCGTRLRGINAARCNRPIRACAVAVLAHPLNEVTRVTLMKAWECEERDGPLVKDYLTHVVNSNVGSIGERSICSLKRLISDLYSNTIS